jgi:putative oxidoreductase
MGRTDGHIISRRENSLTTPPFAVQQDCREQRLTPETRYVLINAVIGEVELYDMGYRLMEGQEVDWKRLVQFALLGSSDLEPYAILLVRVSLGLFFAISGANKLFVAGSRQTMYETLVEAKVPFPHLMTYFVSVVELVGGSLLTVGFLSSLACVALLVDMLVAILTTKLSAMPKGLSPLNWLDDFLYLPEVLYVLFFIWLISFGPGKFSVDYWLAGKLQR